MGAIDRIIRIIAGIIIIGIGLYFKNWWGLVGLIFLATAAVRWCPAYVPLGISTVKKESEENTGQ
jgi:hypothetical protein